MNSLPDELNGLLHYCHSLAKLLLDEQGEFYPFGTYLNNELTITQRMFHDGDDFPLSTGLINIIQHDFDQQLAAGLLRASAITYEARVTNEHYNEPVEVIAVRFNAVYLESPIVYYLPFKVTADKVEYLVSWIELE
ncbi:hypothetical protein [Pedobacter sp. L105]|uniref:hypothetical protein n=1 Tax=Pedobacter sp. L105 TaxID=1641871 RepID=UPI00131DD1F5|nr:hypothetical protein [Pedobacter sp. L105]